MAKIYVDKNDIKYLYDNYKTKLTDTLKFHKKYVKIYDYFLETQLLPNVLVNMIINYINYEYFVDYYYVKQNKYITLVIRGITNNNTNEELIKYDDPYNGIYLTYNNVESYDMFGGIISSVYKDEICRSKNENNYYADDMPLTDFFNYFMEQCYNIEHYLCKKPYRFDYFIYDDCIIPEIDDNKAHYLIRKILNYKEMKNLAVIFKILFKIIKKISEKN